MGFARYPFAILRLSSRIKVSFSSLHAYDEGRTDESSDDGILLLAYRAAAIERSNKDDARSVEKKIMELYSSIMVMDAGQSASMS